MAKIVNLRLTNILGLKTAELELNGKSATIGGKNGQGKSSLQRGLKMILGGKEFMPDEPVNRDADKAEGEIELDNGYVVNWKAKGRKTELRVKHKDNPLFSSDSVTLIKGLFGNLSFDPGEVIAKGDKALAESLRAICQLDFSELDQRRAAAYSERTEIGRDVKRLEGQIASLTLHEDAPEQEESSAEIVAEIEAAQKLANTKTGYEAKAITAQGRAEQFQKEVEEIEQEMAQLQERLQGRRQSVLNWVEDVENCSKLAKAVVVPDIEPLKNRLTNVEATNRKVRENKQFRQVQSDLEGFQQEYADRTATILGIDTLKGQRLAEAEMPIDGLTLDDEGVRFNGTLWSGLSESEQWEVATSVAFALNPQGVVFISRSGGLDIDSRRRVMERAGKLGVQALLEVVDDAPDVLVVIDRGEVKENRLEQEAAA